MSESDPEPDAGIPTGGGVAANARGTITIEWTAGDDPGDYDSYAWKLECDPPLPDEAVEALLAEVARLY